MAPCSDTATATTSRIRNLFTEKDVTNAKEQFSPAMSKKKQNVLNQKIACFPLMKNVILQTTINKKMHIMQRNRHHTVLHQTVMVKYVLVWKQWWKQCSKYVHNQEQF